MILKVQLFLPLSEVSNMEFWGNFFQGCGEEFFNEPRRREVREEREEDKVILYRTMFLYGETLFLPKPDLS
jgi:hypothetical protein